MSLQRIANAEAAAIVEEVARALVDHPDAVVVRVAEQQLEGAVIRLYVAESDRGQVIGKRGRTAHALRVLLTAVGSHRGQRYALDIVEPPEAREPAGIHAVSR